MKNKWKNLLIAMVISVSIVGIIEYFIFLPELNRSIDQFKLNQLITETGNPFSQTEGMGDIDNVLVLHNIEEPFDDPTVKGNLNNMIIFGIVMSIALTMIFYFLIGKIQN